MAPPCTAAAAAAADSRSAHRRRPHLPRRRGRGGGVGLTKGMPGYLWCYIHVKVQSPRPEMHTDCRKRTRSTETTLPPPSRSLHHWHAKQQTTHCPYANPSRAQKICVCGGRGWERDGVRRNINEWRTVLGSNNQTREGGGERVPARHIGRCRCWTTWVTRSSTARPRSAVGTSSECQR